MTIASFVPHSTVGTARQPRTQKDVNQMYASIGKVVVDTASSVISAVRNVYDSLKTNAPLLQSIAFTSMMDEHLDDDPGMAFGSFQSIFESMGPSSPFAFSHHSSRIHANRHASHSQPIIEELSDEDCPPSRSSGRSRISSNSSNSKHQTQQDDFVRKDTPDPRSFARSVKHLKVSSNASSKSSPKSSSKPSPKPRTPVKKDIVLDTLVPVKAEKERPKDVLYEGVPDGVHIDEAFMNDLQKLSGSGKSMTAQIMPALSVCVSQFKKF